MPRGGKPARKPLSFVCSLVPLLGLCPHALRSHALERLRSRIKRGFDKLLETVLRLLLGVLVFIRLRLRFCGGGGHGEYPLGMEKDA